MEWLSGKALRNTEAMSELNQLYEEWAYRQAEVSSLLAMLEEHPEYLGEDDDIQEITPEEAAEDDVRKILKEITDKVINRQNDDNNTYLATFPFGNENPTIEVVRPDQLN